MKDLPPDERAKKIFSKFMVATEANIEMARKCALKAVSEIWYEASEDREDYWEEVTNYLKEIYK